MAKTQLRKPVPINAISALDSEKPDLRKVVVE